jgi:hypothetical protein
MRQKLGQALQLFAMQDNSQQGGAAAGTGSGKQRQIRYQHLIGQYGDIAEGGFLCHTGEEDDAVAAGTNTGRVKVNLDEL